MAGGSKPPVTPVLGDSIPSSILWLSGAQVLTIHTDIHIIKNNNKIHFKTSNEKKSKNKNNNKQPDRFEKEVPQTCSCLWWVSGGGRGGVSKGGGGLAQGALRLGSLCLSAQSASSHTVTSQDQSHHSHFLKNLPHSRQGLPPMLAVSIRYHALHKK